MWFCIRSNHALTHQLSQVSFDARQFFYWVVGVDTKKKGSDKSKLILVVLVGSRYCSITLQKDWEKLIAYIRATTWKSIQLEWAEVSTSNTKNRLSYAINVLFNYKKGIYTTRRSALNENCSRQANLLMSVAGKKALYGNQEVFNFSSFWSYP